MAGMVIATQNLVTKTGKPWGKFTLEDYNGTHEFALFSKDYENFRKYLFNDYFLFIRGKVQPKPYNDKELEFKITSMVQLSEMRDTMIKEMYIQLIRKRQPSANGIQTDIVSARAWGLGSMKNSLS